MIKKLFFTALIIFTATLFSGTVQAKAEDSVDFYELLESWEEGKAKKPDATPEKLQKEQIQKPSAGTAPEQQVPKPPQPKSSFVPENKVEAKTAPETDKKEAVAKASSQPKAAVPAAKPASSPAPLKIEAKKPAEPKQPEAVETKIIEKKKKVQDEILLVDDFNGGVRSNLLGGAMGEWSKDEYDDTQSAEIDFVERPHLGKSGGYSMQISYDVDSPNQAYNGVWIKLNGLDASDYKYLVMYLKAPNYPPYGTDNLKLELKNKKREVGSYQIKRIPKGAWREYKIPLKKFKGLKDLSELKELIIVFEDKTAEPKEGIIFLEHLYFTKGEIRRPS